MARKTTSVKKAAPKPAAPKTGASKAAKLAPAAPVQVSAKPAQAPAAAAIPPIAKPVICITHDQIAQRAYEVWLAKGQPQGQDYQNWTQAERKLKAELGLA